MAPQGHLSAAQGWQRWRVARDRAVRAPWGPLALTGTHWFDSELTLPGLPGSWNAANGEVRLTARAGDGVLVDDEPLDGAVAVRSDVDERPTVVQVGQRRLVLIDREGVLAVRVYDPESPALQAFRGIDQYPFDERWVRPAVFTAYDAERTTRVPHVDGVERGLLLGGEVAVELDDGTARLAVEIDPETRAMQAVVSDATSGDGSYRFRFLDLDAPDDDGRVTADLNRLRLPPCAFSKHFVCPFPPPGNRLPVAIEAGERFPLWRNGSAPH